MVWSINMLLQWDSSENPEVDRVLYVNPEKGDMILISIFDRKANPRRENVKTVENSLDAGEVRTLTVDPFATIEPDEDSLSVKHTRRRERAWKAIAPVVSLSEMDRFF